jgi:hypothetical protein
MKNAMALECIAFDFEIILWEANLHDSDSGMMDMHLGTVYTSSYYTVYYTLCRTKECKFYTEEFSHKPEDMTRRDPVSLSKPKARAPRMVAISKTSWAGNTVGSPVLPFAIIDAYCILSSGYFQSKQIQALSTNTNQNREDII